MTRAVEDTLGMTDLEAAVEEAETIQRLSALDHQTILDIAHDYEVSARDIYKSLDMKWPEEG